MRWYERQGKIQRRPLLILGIYLNQLYVTLYFFRAGRCRTFCTILGGASRSLWQWQIRPSYDVEWSTQGRLGCDRSRCVLAASQERSIGSIDDVLGTAPEYWEWVFQWKSGEYHCDCNVQLCHNEKSRSHNIALNVFVLKLRAFWYAMEVTSQSNTDINAGVCQIIWDKGSSPFDFDRYAWQGYISHLTHSWPMKPTAIHSCCTPAFVIRIIKPSECARRWVTFSVCSFLTYFSPKCSPVLLYGQGRTSEVRNG
jgi:hypothetical protein